MKTRLLSILLGGLLPAASPNWSIAAPAPPGRPKEIASFPAHRYHANDMTFSPDGKTLLTGGHEGTIKLWDVASGKTLFDMQEPHREARQRPDGLVMRSVRGVAFSPDGKTFASCGDDRNVYVWDAATRRKIDTFRRPVGPQLMFSPDGKTLLCGGWRIDLITKEVREIMKGGGLQTVAFDPKSEILYATRHVFPEEPGFSLWDVKSAKMLFTCKTHSRGRENLAFSRDGRTVASVGDDKTVRLWDASTGEQKAVFDNLPRWSYGSATFSPDGKILAMTTHTREEDSWREPGHISLLSVSSGKIVATLRGYKRGVSCMAFSPDGQLLASGCYDGAVKIWSLPARYAPYKEPQENGKNK